MNQALLQSWLSLQCQAMPGAVSACARVHPRGEEAESLSVVWPVNGSTDEELRKLLDMAEQSDGAVTATPRARADGKGPLLRIAHPIDSDGEIKGAIAISLERIPDSQHRSVLRLIEWGNSWLGLLQHQSGNNEQEQLLAGAIQCVLQAQSLHHAAIALCGYLAHRCGYERVALGLKRQRGYQLLALSDSAQIPARSELARLLRSAMQEAETRAPLLHWPADGDPPAHHALAETERDSAVVTLLLPAGSGHFGALCCESQRAEPHSAAELNQLKGLATHLGPLLALKRAGERRLSISGQRQQETRPHAALLRRALIAFLLLAAGLYLAGGDRYRVGGPAELEGALHRALIAPFDGYIASAHARAGETVARGTLLAELEDRELKLELRQLQGEQSELEKQYRQALARLEHAQARIFEAQIAQAEARIELLQQQLERVRLRAPFDGVVVAGDLKRGEVLLEVAPLADYRVAIEVAGRDIAEIDPGEHGTLLLAARPERPLRFTVSNITRMPGGSENAGRFRVEARLLDGDEDLRPGLRGVAKVDAGERSRFWIWSHEISDWMRYRLWAWLP